LDRFRADYVARNEAFNRHDFEAAFVKMPGDILFDVFADMPGARTLRGPRAMIAYFQGVVDEFPDWRAAVEAFAQPVPGVVFVTFLGHGTSRLGGVPVSIRMVQAWDFRSQPVRVTEHRDEAEATKHVAAAARPSDSP
jgi:hypothetical protein